MSEVNQALINEFTHEAASTRKMLERVPLEKQDYKPHGKSMKLGGLAVHVAGLAGWIAMILNTDELDFSKWDYKPHQPKDNADLLRHFDEHVQQSVDALKKASAEDMMKPWSMRSGDHVFFTMPKVAAIRSFAMNHMIHHRGQLSVYLRLNEVPVPGMYGPSADEM